MVNLNEQEATDTVPVRAADEILERSAESLGGTATPTVVCGAPVERDGMTVIPVVRVTGASACVAGSERSRARKKAPATGSVIASPVGYTEIKGGKTTFRPIKESPPQWAVPPR